MASKLASPLSNLHRTLLIRQSNGLCLRQAICHSQKWCHSTSTSRPYHSSTNPARQYRPASTLGEIWRTSWDKPNPRYFSRSAQRNVDVKPVRPRRSSGPFSWKAVVLFIFTGVSMTVYFRYEKARLERKRIVEMSKGVGKPKVGGPFTLTDLEGNTFTEANLGGKYNVIYFGFTHCPDICPDELDKMARAIEIVKEKCGNVLRPLFITCDPARDSPEVLRKYLDEFHTDLIGLTGTYEQVKHVCKMYRVYFSTPEGVKPGDDYLVDHSIYFYVMDPEGDFVECIGRQDTPESAAGIMIQHIKDWKKPLDRS